MASDRPKPPKRAGKTRLPNLSVEDFGEKLDVSRETLDRLESFGSLLTRWNSAINLVSADSLGDLWQRHMLDSAQLIRYLPKSTGLDSILVDLGSGAGFPGIVLSIMGVKTVHLVESDQRKAIFLREVAREVGSDAHIHAVRIEQMREFAADVVTARALAPLPKLLEYAQRFLPNGGTALFLKGQSVEQELEAASDNPRIAFTRHPSRSDPSGVILEVGITGHDRTLH